MRFGLSALARELALIGELSAPFMEAESTREIQQAMYRLKTMPQGSPRSSWEISTPLRTRRSTGEYAQNQRGEHTVRANITTLWEITRVSQDVVAVRDNVSSAVSITNEDDEIARWTMDIAAVSSAPGCGLHAQVKEHPTWFPGGFDVPRLPLFIPTLGAVLEFVLGELFQQQWTKHVSGHTSAKSWRELQRRAWQRWLGWQQEIVKTSTVSPWLDVKACLCNRLDQH